MYRITNMKQFNVIVHYEGCICYRVTAKDKDDAEEIAEAMFSLENPRTIVDNLADSEVCDSWEDKRTVCASTSM